MLKKLYVILFFISGAIFGNDTLFVSKSFESKAINSNINHIIDLNNDYNEFNISDAHFENSSKKKLNFGYLKNDVWLKFNVKNIDRSEVSLFIELSNPDIDTVLFILDKQDKFEKIIETGELYDASTREVYHRNFVNSLKLKPHQNATIYINISNGGHSLYAPITVYQEKYFYISNAKKESVNWLIYGMLFFIVLFNAYLFLKLSDKIYLFYSLYVFFATFFFMFYDGYSFYLNPPPFISNIKFVLPSIFTLFLLKFAQIIISDTDKFRWFNKIVNPLLILVFILPFFYLFKYPLFLITDIGGDVIMLIVFILLAVISALSIKQKQDSSSITFLAFFIVLCGLMVHLFKETTLLPVNFFTESAIKLGITIQGILLTIAIIERFRIQQNFAQQTIKNNLVQIEKQNKELEIINTELEKLSIVASETDNAVSIYDTKGRIEWCNSEFEWFYDVSLKEVFKNKKDAIKDIIPNEQIETFFNKCREHKEPVLFETQVLIKQNKNIWVQTTLSPYIVKNKVKKIIAIDADITKLKKYEEDMEDAVQKAQVADRLKTVFLGNMSHELRTPLNGIIGFSDLLQSGKMPPEKHGKFLKIIKENGEQLVRIIDDIVDVSLIESNTLKINQEECNVKELVLAEVEFFKTHRNKLKKAEIEISHEININKEDEIIVTDGIRVKQVLTNILNNAFKFTKEGYVKVGCYADEKNINFFVEDTGIGVKPEMKEAIFERFRQQEETLNRTYGGTGVGLSISKGILDNMNGEIWLDSSYTKGARFCFTIPKKTVKRQDNKEIKKSKISKAKALNGKDILIVEDEPASFFYLNESLEEYNPNIDHATDGVQAVEMAKNKKYNLILMDINLPNMDGMTATRLIREFDSSTPIIAQTAYAMVTEREKILNSGCTDAISKPVNRKLLVKKIIENIK